MSTKTKEPILTIDLRETLKVIMQKEIEQLPETLESLDPKERLNLICKLLPYILPKTENVKHTLGEPTQFDNW